MKTAAVVSATVGVLGIGATGAEAWTTPTAVGDNVALVNTGGKVTFGSSVACDAAWTGTLDTDPGAGLGGGASIWGGTFSACVPSPVTVAPDFSTPWRLEIVGPKDSGGNAVATITGVRMRVNALGTCIYAGALSASANEASGVVAFSGSLTRISGSCLAGASEPVSGAYLLTDTTTSPAQPRVLF